MSTAPSRKRRVLYWVLTLCFLLPTAGSAIPELFVGGPDAVAKTLLVLGYPAYLMRILGFAKLGGAVTILIGRWPRWTEWAYAGFTFELLGAAASHVLAGDARNAPVPLVFLALMTGSYALSNARRGG